MFCWVVRHGERYYRNYLASGDDQWTDDQRSAYRYRHRHNAKRDAAELGGRVVKLGPKVTRTELAALREVARAAEALIGAPPLRSYAGNGWNASENWVVKMRLHNALAGLRRATERHGEDRDG